MEQLLYRYVWSPLWGSFFLRKRKGVGNLANPLQEDI